MLVTRQTHLHKVTLGDLTVEHRDRTGWLQVRLDPEANERLTVFLTASHMRELALALETTANELDAGRPGPKMPAMPMVPQRWDEFDSCHCPAKATEDCTLSEAECKARVTVYGPIQAK